MNAFAWLVTLIAVFGSLLPLPTLQPFDLPAALAAAQPGDTIVIPPGVYAGPLVVDVPGLTLEGQEGAIIDGGGLGDVFTVSANLTGLPAISVPAGHAPAAFGPYRSPVSTSM
jgi:nitrous oxidase accessory protein